MATGTKSPPGKVNMSSSSSSSSSSSLSFLSSQLFSVVGNCSVVVKALCGAVCVGYLLSFSSTATGVLTIVPGNLLPPNFWVWTLATHGPIETHWWMAMVDVLVLLLYGKLVEPLWGAQQMVVFYAVVNLCVAVLTTVTYLFLYLLVGNTDLLFNTHINGLAGYLAGFSVAVKQTMPDHIIINSSFGKLRNRHIPLLMVAIAFLVRVVGVVDPPFPIMFAWGFVVSWVYLRFYQKHSNGTKGDAVDTFAFPSFFPKALQPFIAILGNSLFSVLVTLRLCKKAQRKFEAVSPPVIVVNLPGTEAHDAERRRQLALKALNDRLTKTVSPAWPSMEDDTKLLPETSSAQVVEPTVTDKVVVDDLEKQTYKPTERLSSEGTSRPLPADS